MPLGHAVRSLLRAPSFLGGAVVTLALGIGVNAAIFSVVDAVLLRRAPFEAFGRLVLVWETDRHSGTTREPASYPDFVDLRARSRALASAGALIGGQTTVAAARGATSRATLVRVSHDLIPTLEFSGVRGRVFTADDDRPNGPGVVLLGERFATRALGGGDALGRVLQVDGRPHSVIGVVPAAADLGVLQILSAAAYARAFADQGTQTEVDFWLPRQASVESLPRSTHPLFIVGRLADGATVPSARDELSAIAADLERAHPENEGRGVFVEPLSSVVFGPGRA